VILLDLMMPVMDGWQFLDALQERVERAVPFVVLTAQLAAGVVGRPTAVLRKPVSLALLMATVAQALRSAGSADGEPTTK
jgi:CheY-like chemotaxis protein